MGAPVVNDGLYSHMANFLWRGPCDDEVAENLVQSATSSEDVDIGLQCTQLSFEDVHVRAPEPWWQKCLSRNMSLREGLSVVDLMFV